MLKDYETDKIIVDTDQNLENPNLVIPFTNEIFSDIYHHSHGDSASTSDVASVLSLMSAAIADLGADTTEIDSAIAALTGEEVAETESESEEETETESEGESEEDSETEDESEGETEGESEGETEEGEEAGEGEETGSETEEDEESEGTEEGSESEGE